METLDPLDLLILKQLQDDASLTIREIGDKLNKSPGSIQKRVQRLRNDGVITKYTVLLDSEKVGLSFMAFTSVQLKDHSEETLTNFEQQIIQFPEVLECHHMTGGYDFILRIVAKNQQDYHTFLMQKLFKTLGVGHVETKIVMKTAKSETALPIRSDYSS